MFTSLVTDERMDAQTDGRRTLGLSLTVWSGLITKLPFRCALNPSTAVKLF